MDIKFTAQKEVSKRSAHYEEDMQTQLALYTAAFENKMRIAQEASHQLMREEFKRQIISVENKNTEAIQAAKDEVIAEMDIKLAPVIEKYNSMQQTLEEVHKSIKIAEHKSEISTQQLMQGQQQMMQFMQSLSSQPQYNNQSNTQHSGNQIAPQQQQNSLSSYCNLLE